MWEDVEGQENFPVSADHHTQPKLSTVLPVSTWMADLPGASRSCSWFPFPSYSPPPPTSGFSSYFITKGTIRRAKFEISQLLTNLCPYFNKYA